MLFVLVDIEIIKEIYPHWRYLRKSNDGTKCIIHKEILDKYRPPIKKYWISIDLQ